MTSFFGHRPISIQQGIDSTNITNINRQDENSEIQLSNIIDLEMYDNVPDPFDGSMPSTLRDIGVMPIKIKNSTNIDTSVVDNLDDNSDKIHQNINTTIDKTSNIDKNMNIGSGNYNISKINPSKVNNENNNETKPKKIEMNDKKEKFYNATHPLKLKKH